MQKIKWQCRYAPSLGALEGTPKQVWGTKEYKNDTDATVFFGLYGLNDFYALWRHKGEKHILWAGTDIQHFLAGYWLDDTGKIRITAFQLAPWIDTYCTSWVENEVEKNALASVGIRSKVVPSFMGNVKDFKVSFKPGNKVYTSVSGNNFKLYGWDKIPQLARNNPNIEFHLYGNTIHPGDDFNISNIIIHGRVPKEQMNSEIKDMQGSLRLTQFDGASELIVKAILWGQYTFSFIPYIGVNRVEELSLLLSLKDVNIKGREWWLKNLNKYPWNIHN